MAQSLKPIKPECSFSPRDDVSLLLASAGLAFYSHFIYADVFEGNFYDTSNPGPLTHSSTVVTGTLLLNQTSTPLPVSHEAVRQVLPSHFSRI